jgi:hypothetical protein
MVRTLAMDVRERTVARSEGGAAAERRAAFKAILAGALFAPIARKDSLASPLRDAHDMDGLADHVGGALFVVKTATGR